MPNREKFSIPHRALFATNIDGGPIPTVIREPHATTLTNDTSLPSSIDAGIVTRMFAEDLTLFKSILGRMLREYADLALPICAPFNDKATRYRLKARAHKLKGSAGMVGATLIMRLAGAAEGALMQDLPDKLVDALFEQLAAALATLDEEAGPYLRNERESDVLTGNANKHPVSIGPPQLDALCALLDRQNLQALDQFQSLSRSLSAILPAACFDRLREAIETLDFQGGAKLLREPRGLSERGIGAGKVVVP